ncbi:MAG: hypothetical protein BWY32_01904 [bacterium ADurb.Bin243]|nr:MAG: hypothetical protein BWY32_01904 [bacterium ADurb.Bin243]
MLNFCTLFDINYLSRGLALYESLERNCASFHLYIFPFDDKALEILLSLNLKHATIVSLKEFEDEELLKLKSGRTPVEYCWTCTPSIILYSLEKFNLDFCTYLDADTYFFSDPLALFDEFKSDISIIITQHRYTPKYDATKESGKYCVQFVTIRNDGDGLKALKWWRQQCNEWCYFRYEEGRLGDQKYLDDWLTRFNGVHELAHLGGGLAPWNVQQYDIFQKGAVVAGIEKTSGLEFKAVFFHFHALKFYDNGTVKLNNDHDTSFSVRKLIYKPYITHIIEICRRIGEKWPGVDVNATIKGGGGDSASIFERIKNIIRRKRYEAYSVYNIVEFEGLWRYMSWHV